MDCRAWAGAVVLVVGACTNGDSPSTTTFGSAGPTTAPVVSDSVGESGDDDTGEGDSGSSSSGDPVTGPPPLTESSAGETSVGDGSSGGSDSGTSGGAAIGEFDDCPGLDMAGCMLQPQCLWAELEGGGQCTPNAAHCQVLMQAQCDLEAECVWTMAAIGGETCTVDCMALEQTACMTLLTCYWSPGGDGLVAGCYPSGFG